MGFSAKPQSKREPSWCEKGQNFAKKFFSFLGHVRKKKRKEATLSSNNNLLLLRIRAQNIIYNLY